MGRGAPSRRDVFAVTAGAALLAVGVKGAEMPREAKTLPFEREIPILKARDVVVCGGGPSGIAAALAARRAGLDVLLVEGQGQLGGMSTSGMVSHWLGGRTSDCKRWVVGGIFRELSEEAAKHGAALIPKRGRSKYQPHGWYRGQLEAGIPLDPFGVAAYLDEKMAKEGIDLLLLTQAVDVRVEGGRISHVIVHNKSGLAAVPAKAARQGGRGRDGRRRRRGPQRLRGRERRPRGRHGRRHPPVSRLRRRSGRPLRCHPQGTTSSSACSSPSRAR